MAGITKHDVTTVFNGQADIVLFGAPTGGYTDSTTFAQVTASGDSLGQIVEDSTSWEGDEPSIETINDEQGDVIVAQATAGTYAFSCDVASTDKALLAKLLKAADVTLGTGSTSATIGSASEIVKVVDLPVQTAPIGIFNDEANRFILFPKAKIVGSITLDSKLWRIHLNATAEYIDTTELGTFMMGKGSPTYATA